MNLYEYSPAFEVSICMDAEFNAAVRLLRLTEAGPLSGFCCCSYLTVYGGVPSNLISKTSSSPSQTSRFVSLSVLSSTPSIAANLGRGIQETSKILAV